MLPFAVPAFHHTIFCGDLQPSAGQITGSGLHGKLLNCRKNVIAPAAFSALCSLMQSAESPYIPYADLWTAGGRIPEESPKTAWRCVFARPQGKYPQAVEDVDSFWRFSEGRVSFGDGSRAGNKKYAPYSSQGGRNPGAGKRIYPKGQRLSTAMWMDRPDFPHVILWPKGSRQAGLEPFSTESTTPTAATIYILLLSM